MSQTFTNPASEPPNDAKNDRPRLPWEEPLDRRVVLKLSGRELIALSKVSRDMQLSHQETIRSLILAATLDLGRSKHKKGAKL